MAFPPVDEQLAVILRGAAQVDVIALHDCYASNELLL